MHYFYVPVKHVIKIQNVHNNLKYLKAGFSKSYLNKRTHATSCSLILRCRYFNEKFYKYTQTRKSCYKASFLFLLRFITPKAIGTKLGLSIDLDLDTWV